MLKLKEGDIDEDLWIRCQYINLDLESLQQKVQVFSDDQIRALKGKFESTKNDQAKPKVKDDTNMKDILLMKLNSQIESMHKLKCADKKWCNTVQKCLSDFENLLQHFKHGPEQGFNVLAYGSSINGLALKGSSDLDLTILCPDETCSKTLLTNVKEFLSSIFFGGTRYTFKDAEPIKISSGWLLRFKDNALQMEIDLMVNKKAEVLNSHLILEYNYDIRFEKVAQMLKLWNKSLEEDGHAHLNNYSLYLMLIAYMQKEGLLPNLQKGGEKVIQCLVSTPHGSMVYPANVFYKETTGYPILKPETSPATILFGFMEFYAS